jgi:hypothetical protein
MQIIALMLLGTACLIAETTKKPAPPPAKASQAPAKSSPPQAKVPGSVRAPNTEHAGPTARGGSAAITTANRPTANGTRPTASAVNETAHPPRKPGAPTAAVHTVSHPAIDHGHPMPRGTHVHEFGSGNAIARRSDGGLRDMHDASRHMDIHYELGGGRRISVVRPDGSRIVAERGRPGFIERRYGFYGRDYTRRTFYYHGRTYDRFYRDYLYHGVGLYIYAPIRFYSVGFYGWAYHPWGMPVVYAWNWDRSLWTHSYGFYFAPSHVYAGPSLWITDYMISNDLQAEYEAGTPPQLPDPDGSSPMLTPEIKARIANEVQGQIALENAESPHQAQNQSPEYVGIARTLADGQQHVFLVGGALDVTDITGAECVLSGGDVLETTEPPPPDDATATLTVLSSKGRNECARSANVTVALDDLQEMQNHMRETIDQGLEQLSQNQGKNGIPAAPPSATTPPTTLAFAAMAPPPDPNGIVEVNQEFKEADRSEQDMAIQEKQPTGGNASSPN